MLAEDLKLFEMVTREDEDGPEVLAALEYPVEGKIFESWLEAVEELITFARVATQEDEDGPEVLTALEYPEEKLFEFSRLEAAEELKAFGRELAEPFERLSIEGCFEKIPVVGVRYTKAEEDPTGVALVKVRSADDSQLSSKMSRSNDDFKGGRILEGALDAFGFTTAFRVVKELDVSGLHFGEGTGTF